MRTFKYIYLTTEKLKAKIQTCNCLLQIWNKGTWNGKRKRKIFIYCFLDSWVITIILPESILYKNIYTIKFYNIVTIASLVRLVFCSKRIQSHFRSCIENKPCTFTTVPGLGVWIHAISIRGCVLQFSLIKEPTRHLQGTLNNYSPNPWQKFENARPQLWPQALRTRKSIWRGWRKQFVSRFPSSEDFL